MVRLKEKAKLKQNDNFRYWQLLSILLNLLVT